MKAAGDNKIETACCNSSGFLDRFIYLFVLLFAISGCTPASEYGELVGDLREGGFVIVMRHASSPSDPPAEEVANPDNIDRERQLDEEGRQGAAAMGEAIRRLGIPISEVESSPTYRTLETGRLAGFDAIQVRGFLGNQGMQVSSQAFAARLRDNLANKPVGSNRLLITHSPNIAAGFPALSPEVEQGESLIIDPDVSISVPIARVRIDEWQDM